MNRRSPSPPADTLFAEDELLEIQLRVARRADELSHSRGRHTQTDLQRWLDAENDVLNSLLPGRHYGTAGGLADRAIS